MPKGLKNGKCNSQRNYGTTFDNNYRILVEGANPSFIRSLKYQLGNNVGYEQGEYFKKSFHGIISWNFW